uniref:Variant surface glycoprotein n=1 Tax=Trypanosoma brucei TaxID=5691 RepID=A0A1V0G084_9TRYP|nr:variant surface glycoprotein [Trypanosoma brucei]
MTTTPKATADLQRILILYLALLLFEGNLVAGDADDNAGQHHVMCLLSGMANSPITAAAVTDSGASAKELISAFNITTSSIDWQNMFDTSLDRAKGTELPDSLKDKPYAANWKTSWASWWQAAKHAKSTNIGQEAHELYKPIKSDVQKALAHKQLRQLALEAETLNGAYEAAKKQAEETQKQLAETKLMAALYGGAGTKATAGTPHTRTAFTTWATACEKAVNGKSLIGDFFCLCTPKDGTTKECADGYTPAQWSGDIANPSSTWNSLKNSCPAAKFEKVTAHDIRMGITTFLKALTAKTKGGATKTYLGTSDDGSCDGTSSKLCVDYTDYFSKTTSKTYKDIPWLKSLDEAATSIENMHKQQEKANSIGAQLAILLQQANLIYTAALNGELANEIAVTWQPERSGTTRQDVNCAQYDSNKTCVSPCKWESKGDKGICKLGESKVETPADAAGTGGEGATEAAATTGCAAHGTDKTKCDGDKSCKWENNACKDSSILVTKQFALSVVSAAFAALLF